MVYFPQEKYLTPFSQEHKEAVYEAVDIIRNHLPQDFYGKRKCEINKVDFFIDNNMVEIEGLKSVTQFFHKNRVCVSPLIASSLLWEDKNGIPFNEIAMNTIIYELTHLQQMRWLGGLIFIILKIPFVSWFTLERWAVQNATKATETLIDVYSEQR